MSGKYFSIAIDGPSGAGKSTMARRVAKELGFVYVDTGAIYRTVGYYVRMLGIGAKDVDGVTRLLDEISISIEYGDDGRQHMILNNMDVTDEIRTPEISMYASGVSSLPVVRAFLLDMQRDLARRNNVIMDGRDIGTVVLPNADVKIFLTASDEERAKRRFLELQEKGEKTTLQEVLSDMRRRDEQDSTRACAPLKQADDAVLLDTSSYDIEQSAQAILDIVRNRLAQEQA
ncbi:MAG: (d)CMP kinase [Oscillospiraceae bacterium]|nr:(d)CMP kinase [Oscillospiraceae bacterium]